MRLHLVRHGETDWQLVSKRGVTGLAASLAPLTPTGRLQIDAIAADYRLQEADAILCSSYSRALESAALLSRKLNLSLYVEYDLHEWLPQRDPHAEFSEELMLRASESLEKELLEPSDEPTSWESLTEVRTRVLNVLDRYRQFGTLVVVTHAVVISSLVGTKRSVDHAEIVTLELDLDAPAAGASQSLSEA